MNILQTIPVNPELQKSYIKNGVVNIVITDEGKRFEKPCPECHNLFLADQPQVKCCSPKCSAQAKSKSVSRAMKNNTPWNKGKTGIYSDETRKAMGNQNVGRKLTEEHKTSISNGLSSYYETHDGPNKDKPMPEAQKIKIRRALTKN